jgi:hypothetical protein
VYPKQQRRAADSRSLRNYRDSLLITRALECVAFAVFHDVSRYVKRFSTKYRKKFRTENIECPMIGAALSVSAR